jgi:aspartyl-tRNA(Asn)/glutamyl-tRNA(Gln) amidotransferase subunit A
MRLLSGRQTRLNAARARRNRLTGELGHVLADQDVLLSPTMPTTAPVLEGITSVEQMADPMVAPYTDCWTVVANLAGLPALSVPSGLSEDDGMPVGTMLMGASGADALLLRVAAAWELAPTA